MNLFSKKEKIISINIYILYNYECNHCIKVQNALIDGSSTPYYGRIT